MLYANVCFTWQNVTKVCVRNRAHTAKCGEMKQGQRMDLILSKVAEHQDLDIYQLLLLSSIIYLSAVWTFISGDSGGGGEDI